VTVQVLILSRELTMFSFNFLEFGNLKSKTIDLGKEARFISLKSLDFKIESLNLCCSISILIELPHNIGLPFFILVNISDKNITLIAERSIFSCKWFVFHLEVSEKTKKLIMKAAGITNSRLRLGANEFIKMSGSWIALITCKCNNFIEFRGEIVRIIDSWLESIFFS